MILVFVMLAGFQQRSKAQLIGSSVKNNFGICVISFGAKMGVLTVFAQGLEEKIVFMPPTF